MTFTEVCKVVVNEQKNEYAKAYAGAGIGMTDPAAIRAQSLYILNNLQGWRGDRAKEIKKLLKSFS